MVILFDFILTSFFPPLAITWNKVEILVYFWVNPSIMLAFILICSITPV